jgi:hypothetical protein
LGPGPRACHEAAIGGWRQPAIASATDVVAQVMGWDARPADPGDRTLDGDHASLHVTSGHRRARSAPRRMPAAAARAHRGGPPGRPLQDPPATSAALSPSRSSRVFGTRGRVAPTTGLTSRTPFVTASCRARLSAARANGTVLGDSSRPSCPRGLVEALKATDSRDWESDCSCSRPREGFT